MTTTDTTVRAHTPQKAKQPPFWNSQSHYLFIYFAEAAAEMLHEYTF